MFDWSEKERENPELNKVYGFDRKSDDGWENLVFFVENPAKELVDRFNELKNKVPNSSYSEPYNENSEIWIFGWF